MFKIPLRNYRIARLYGPGMDPSCKEGFHEKVIEKDVNTIGLVLVHCWNVGDEDGPYPHDKNVTESGDVSDWVIRAHMIINEQIKPVLDAARSAKIKVFHLAQNVYAPKYPQYTKMVKDPDMRDPRPRTEKDGCINPRSLQTHFEDEYGPGYPGPLWETDAEKFNISTAVRPTPEEMVYLNGWQLNKLCRSAGIDTLFFAGFMADLCIVNIPGAIREMYTRFGYPCVVLRECTTAYEFHDTKATHGMTTAAIRQVETDLGYSVSAKDFINGCRS